MAKLSREDVVTVLWLAKRGLSNVKIARMLGVTEGAVRYMRRRLEALVVDDRSLQWFPADSFWTAIDHYLAAADNEPLSNTTELFEFQVAQYGYPGSLGSLHRYVMSAVPKSKSLIHTAVRNP